MNGAFGFNFSAVPEDPSSYGKTLRQVNRKLIETGVTSYLPTVCSSLPEVYHQVLPFLGPSGTHRLSSEGSESLGAHCEGPFISPTKNGIHRPFVLQSPTSLSSLLTCYGVSNLPLIRLITAAPELSSGLMTSLIPILTSPPYNLIFSIGHSEATFEEASAAIEKGATMITHLFNAMRPLHHRNPGIFGTLGVPSGTTKDSEEGERKVKRPYFGIIADGIHLHPTSISLAYHAHPQGLILVTDSMHLVGLPDGIYPWHNGDNIIKRGNKLILEGSEAPSPVSSASSSSSSSEHEGEKEAAGEGKIAGSAVLLIDCINNFLEWTGVGIPQAVGTVTRTPARMLGLEGTKGGLEEGKDADLVVLGREKGKLMVDQVWKFGEKVFGRMG